jgi:hypothetical protein
MALLALATCLTGCGGTPFTLEQPVSIDPPASSAPVAAAQGPQDSGAEANEDAGNETSSQDSGDEHEAEASIGAEAAPEAAAVEAAAPDAGVDAAPEAAPIDPPDGCTPLPPSTFGCGPPILVSRPGEFCIDQWGVGNPPAIAAPMPAACRCYETYDCGCLVASGTALCPNGTYVSCSTGTTGGVVVVCR